MASREVSRPVASAQSPVQQHSMGSPPSFLLCGFLMEKKCQSPGMGPFHPHGAGSPREPSRREVIQPLWGLGMQWVWRRGLLRSGEPQRITRWWGGRGGGRLCLKALS